MVGKFDMRRRHRRAKAARPLISAPLTSIPEPELPSAGRRYPQYFILPGAPSQVARRNAIRRRPHPSTGPNGATPSPKPPMSASNVDNSSLPLTPAPQASNTLLPTGAYDLLDVLREFLLMLCDAENDPT